MKMLFSLVRKARIALIIIIIQFAVIRPLIEVFKRRTPARRENETASFPSLLNISRTMNSKNNYRVNEDADTPQFNCDSVLYPVPTITPHATPFSVTSGNTPHTKSNFWTFSNFILAQQRFRCHESITFTTQAEYSYILENLPNVLKRWKGPLSLAMYVPGSDFIEALLRLVYLRECSEDKQLVKNFVTVHLIFDSNNLPQKLSTELSDLIFSEEKDCSSNLLSLRSFDDEATTYRKSNHIIYPINVARNLAKSNSATAYVLVSDIELYPSPGLIQRFLELANEEGHKEKRAYVLPIFEVDGIIKFDLMPRGKADLVKLLDSGLAIPFHEKICHLCHRIPKAKEWRKAKVNEGLHVFHVANRTGNYKHWEPIFIGRRDDPVYDERLSWDGKRDKMTQGYLLCVLGYEMHILDNAFLTHAPGITKKSNTHDTERMAMVKKQNEVISHEILPEVTSLWGQREGCVV